MGQLKSQHSSPIDKSSETVPPLPRTYATMATKVACIMCSYFSCMLALSGCAGGSPEPFVTTVDSAGVQLVEAHRPLWRSSPPWTLSDSPILAIGTLEGAVYEEFATISAVARLTDGRFVVADIGSSQIRFFGPDGQFLSVAGRRGQGPGEFKLLSSLHVLDGDSLLAFDASLHRFSVFGPAGEFVRTFRPDAPGGGLVWSVVQTGNRAMVLATAVPFAGGQTETGIYRDSALFLLADLRGRVRDSIARLPISEGYVQIGPEFRTNIGRPFGRVTHVVGADGRLFVTISDTYRIDVYGMDGQLERSYKLPVQLRPVTQADIDRYVESRKRLRNERRRRVEARLLRNIPFPATFPAFEDLVLDEEGYLWAQEYHRPGDQTTRWTIVAPDGRWLGRLEGPEGFRAHQIGADYVLGVHTDELGVQQVRVYRLKRN